MPGFYILVAISRRAASEALGPLHADILKEFIAQKNTYRRGPACVHAT